MTATMADNEIERYAAEVAAHLGEVPEAERTELLEDLRQHLSEVAAEGDEPLATRLGAPSAYAAELLASAGLGPAVPPPTGTRSLLHRSAVAFRRAREGRAWRETAEFLPQLRPGWWVLRGVMAAFAFVVAVSDDWDRTWPVPGTGVEFWLLAALLVPASVALGQRAVARGPRRTGRWGTAVVVGAFLLALTAMGSQHDDYYQPVYENPTGLFQTDGRVIANIFPYDAEGRLLEGVLLYDQDGRPIEAHRTADAAGLQSVLPSDANGAPITNAYPLEQHELFEENYGVPTTVQGRAVGQPPAVVVPRQATTTTTTTTEAPPPADPGGVPQS